MKTMPCKALSTVLDKSSFTSTSIAAARIFDVEAISLTVSKHSFQRHNTTYSPSIDIFYTSCKKISYQNIVKIGLHFQTNERLSFHN